MIQKQPILTAKQPHGFSAWLPAVRQTAVVAAPPQPLDLCTHNTRMQINCHQLLSS